MPENKQFFKAVKLNYYKEVYHYIMETKEYIYEMDNTYETGLHWASKRGIKIILLKLKNTGYTKLATLFLTEGAEVDKQNLVGITPLYYALRIQHVSTVKLLLFYGASPWGTFNCNYKSLAL